MGLFLFFCLIFHLEKDEINVPIALSAFRDNFSPSGPFIYIYIMLSKSSLKPRWGTAVAEIKNPPGGSPRAIEGSLFLSLE